jgi:hypothetical protein
MKSSQMFFRIFICVLVLLGQDVFANDILGSSDITSGLDLIYELSSHSACTDGKEKTKKIDGHLPAEYCAVLKQYKSNQQLSFDEKDPLHPCSVTKGKTGFYAAAKSEKRKQLSTYATSDFKSPSYRENLKNGERLMTLAEREQVKMFTEAERSRTAEKCCGENQKCSAALNAVKVVFCDNTDAIKDPNAPDDCSSPLAFYLSQKKMIPDDDIKPGKIEFSPYFSSSYQVIVSHEFGHACSDIWSQIKKDSAVSREEHVKLSDPASCTLDAEAMTHYRIASQAMKIEGLAECLWNVSVQKSPKGYGYVPGSCDRRRLEEGFADALLLAKQTDSGDAVPTVFPNECDWDPSKLHPYRGDILKCMLTHSDKLRSKLASELSCPALSH